MNTHLKIGLIVSLLGIFNACAVSREIEISLVLPAELNSQYYQSGNTYQFAIYDAASATPTLPIYNTSFNGTSGERITGIDELPTGDYLSPIINVINSANQVILVGVLIGGDTFTQSIYGPVFSLHEGELVGITMQIQKAP